MSKRTWLAAVVLAACAGPVAAQTVTGQAVSRPDPLTGVRQPVPGVKVEALDANGRSLGSTSTSTGVAPDKLPAGAFTLPLSGNSDEVSLKFSGTDSNGIPRAETTVASLNPQSSQNLSVVVPKANVINCCYLPTPCPTYQVFGRRGLCHRGR
jgi:hypothetical protein